MEKAHENQASEPQENEVNPSVTKRISSQWAGVITNWFLWKMIIREKCWIGIKLVETGFSIADVVEIAIENDKKEGRLAEGVMPNLYTDG